MPYDLSSVPGFVVKEISSGPVDIVDHGSHFTLYNNGDRWMSYSKDHDGEIKELYSSYDLAYGDVLVSGLGFGILALWLCSKPEVSSVTVVEISEDVISIFKQLNSVPEKLNIINDSMITYETDKKYDVLLLDHYERQDYDWILKDIAKICKRIKHKKIWAWSLELLYLTKMYKKEIFPYVDNLFDEYGDDLSGRWDLFLDKYLPAESMLRNIPNDKLNEYIYNFLNKKTP